MPVFTKAVFLSSLPQLADCHLNKQWALLFSHLTSVFTQPIAIAADVFSQMLAFHLHQLLPQLRVVMEVQILSQVTMSPPFVYMGSPKSSDLVSNAMSPLLLVHFYLPVNFTDHMGLASAVKKVSHHITSSHLPSSFHKKNLNSLPRSRILVFHFKGGFCPHLPYTVPIYRWVFAPSVTGVFHCHC